MTGIVTDPAGPLALAVLGPTGTGKSALAIELAVRFGGEIVSCDSTAVYRGFDIGTDKVPADRRRGIRHHLIDVVDPAEDYTAARYAREAAEAIQAIDARGRLPIVVGGTGFYFRTLTRGLFPGPGREPRLRARLDAVAARRGSEFLHRALRRVDPPSAARIQPRDRMRLVRALEVYVLTGRPLSQHFAATTPALKPRTFVKIGLTLPAAELEARLRLRVDAQFARGLIGEIRTLVASGLPETARPFSGLGYRQGLALIHGVRDEQATRDLIVRETRRYARRQLIWFRKEPNLVWIQGAGEGPGTVAAATRLVQDAVAPAGTAAPGETGR
ncbi:MAG: tRNA (adenosine(37)-N6)-dimethylallyltransferase MiaA [Acidobacteria bacterium]|nr:tRNA (adenosine(37)-N6)-dimethylallyltransferase MiaA [Acidobacteriota bacterium]